MASASEGIRRWKGVLSGCRSLRRQRGGCCHSTSTSNRSKAMFFRSRPFRCRGRSASASWAKPVDPVQATLPDKDVWSPSPRNGTRTLLLAVSADSQTGKLASVCSSTVVVRCDTVSVERLNEKPVMEWMQVLSSQHAAVDPPSRTTRRLLPTRKRIRTLFKLGK